MRRPNPVESNPVLIAHENGHETFDAQTSALWSRLAAQRPFVELAERGFRDEVQEPRVDRRRALEGGGPIAHEISVGVRSAGHF